MVTIITIPPRDTNEMAMSYEEFRKKCLEASTNYTKKTYPNVELEGIYKDKTYDHILKTKASDDNYLEIVKEFNLLPEVKELETKESLLNTLNLHDRVHHLNSSQIMCFNFFRPYIENNKPIKELFELLNDKFNIPIEENENVFCQFEYIPNDMDKTNFDFYVKSGEIEVFFEIKYTEQHFGKIDSSWNEKSKEENFLKYQKYIRDSNALNIIEDIDYDTLDNYYQLFRNVIRITDKNKYVVVIYPKDNHNLEISFSRFKLNYVNNSELSNNVNLIYWEDLVKEGDFFEKYLKIK